MKYPKPEDRYSCEVFCENFMEIEKRFDEISEEKVGKNQLSTVLNDALEQAKVSGDFKGDAGTSVTIERYTESKVDGGNNTVVFSDGNTLRIKNGSKGDKGDTGTAGQSVTHSLDGTILTFTSASGTSSIDLGNRSGDSLELKDVTTGDVYKLYIENGVLKTSVGYDVTVYTEDCSIEISGLHYDSLGSTYFRPNSGAEITLTPSNYATHIESVYVEMGKAGIDISDSVYTQTENGGKIVIPAVTDNVFIQAHGAKETRYIDGIIMHYGGEEFYHLEDEVVNGDSYGFSYFPDSGYYVTEVSVEMGGVDITDTAWNGESGESGVAIDIEHVTADVTINIYADEEV